MCLLSFDEADVRSGVFVGGIPLNLMQNKRCGCRRVYPGKLFSNVRRTKRILAFHNAFDAKRNAVELFVL